MLTYAWVGLGAGLWPKKIQGRAERAMLTDYVAISASAFGALMNMWFLSMLAGRRLAVSSLSLIPGDSVLATLKRFLAFTLLTSTGGWDTGRAITNVVAILVLGPAILAVLRRAVRKASFGAPVEFSYSSPPSPPLLGASSSSRGGSSVSCRSEA